MWTPKMKKKKIALFDNTRYSVSSVKAQYKLGDACTEENHEPQIGKTYSTIINNTGLNKKGSHMQMLHGLFIVCRKLRMRKIFITAREIKK